MKKGIIVLVLCLMAVVAGASADYTFELAEEAGAGKVIWEDSKAPTYNCKRHGEIEEVYYITLRGGVYIFCLHCIVGGLRATIGEVEEVKP